MNWSARKQGESDGDEEEGAEKVDKTLVEHQALIPPGDGGRCGDDDWGGGNIDDDEELTSLHLTLENFDSDQIPDDCPFVLTSPRSLEACKLVGVRVS